MGSAVFGWCFKNTFLTVRAVVKDEDAAVVGTRGTELVRRFEVDEIHTVFVLLHGKTFAAFLLAGAVVVETDLPVPGCGYQNVTLLAPIVQTTDIILFLLVFLGLLELLHLGPVLDVNTEQSPFLITHEQFPLPLVHAYARDLFRSQVPKH